MNAPSKSRALLLPILAAAPLLAALPEGSPYTLPQPPFYGQIRPRMEFDGKNVHDTSSTKNLYHTHLRTRLGFVAAPSPKTEIKVEIQDVRFMGSEKPAAAANPATATIGNSKEVGVDLLQGYFAIEEGKFKTAFGRQKMQLGAGRFLSSLEWSPTSRAFDGWSFNLNLDPGNLTGVAFLVRDTNNTTVKDHSFLSGLYYSHDVMPGIVAEAFGFYDKSTLPAPGGTTPAVPGVTTPAVPGVIRTLNHDLFYFGERVAGKLGMFTFEEEFIWQAGEAAGAPGSLGSKTSAAYQLATRVGAVFGAHKVNAGLDIMSGDDDVAAGDDEINTYRANYYFAHAYFGWMDYFVNNPRAGVMDFRLDGSFAFLPNAAGNPRLTIIPQYHYFTAHNAGAGVDEDYGQELDLEIHLGLYPKSNIVLGAGLFLPGDGAVSGNLPAPGRITKASDSKNGVFLYFMPVFNF